MAVAALELAVGELGANVYAAGDSTLGFSRSQWDGSFDLLDQLALRCEASPILCGRRFMLTYGLVSEFLESAELCKGFVTTWNVGLEAFDLRLLRNDSKGVNRGPEHASEALELASRLDYKLYLSGILGLPGTTLTDLRREVDHWLALAETYADNVTTVSVAAPALVRGSRMYWDTYLSSRELRELPRGAPAVPSAVRDLRAGEHRRAARGRGGCPDRARARDHRDRRTGRWNEARRLHAWRGR